MANELFAGLLGQPESLHCSNRTVGRQPHPKMSDSYPSMLPDGTLFQDRYSVVRCIKAGGMGAVYEVVHLETQRHRALKVMLPQLVANEQMRARFKQEATVAAQVESQHIVEVIDAGVDESTGAPFLVMELLRGNELEELIKDNGPMTPEEVIVLLRQAALALDKTHSANIIHRDLKPENLFICERDDGTPHLKILDFGISKVVAESARGKQDTAMIGTPLYMAPEQIRTTHTIGPAADLYSLAQVAYTMLVGEAYFADESDAVDNPFQLMMSVAEGVDESASVRAERRREITLPQAFDSWFVVATALTPTERFTSASDFVFALADAFDITLTQSTPLRSGQRSGPVRDDIASAPTGLQAPTPPEGSAPIPPTKRAEPKVAPATEVAPVQAESRKQVGSTTAASVADARPASTRRRKKPTLFIGVAAVILVAIGVSLASGLSGKKAAPILMSGLVPTSMLQVLPPKSCPAEMVLIPKGELQMGSAGGEGKPEERPQHKVALDAFCIDKTEVSVGAYRKCVEAGRCRAAKSVSWKGIKKADKQRYDVLCNSELSDRADHPINCTDWDHATAYCRWAGKRLPSEAEWEYAARGSDERKFPWGHGEPDADLVNACGLECREQLGKGAAGWKILYKTRDEWATTAPVGSLPAGASPFGVLNMAGNVREWVRDWFVPYKSAARTNPEAPLKPDDNPRIVMRGGSFFSYTAEFVRSARRFPKKQERRTADSGFRCAMAKAK